MTPRKRGLQNFWCVAVRMTQIRKRTMFGRLSSKIYDYLKINRTRWAAHPAVSGR